MRRLILIFPLFCRCSVAGMSMYCCINSRKYITTGFKYAYSKVRGVFKKYLNTEYKTKTRPSSISGQTMNLHNTGRGGGECTVCAWSSCLLTSFLASTYIYKLHDVDALALCVCLIRIELSVLLSRPSLVTSPPLRSWLYLALRVCSWIPSPWRQLLQCC